MLMKEGGRVRSWKLRWFELNTDGVLRYFHHDSKGVILKGTVPLSDCTAVLPGEALRKVKWPSSSYAPARSLRCCFGVVVPGRTFHLVAPRADECARWRQVLEKYAPHVNPFRNIDDERDRPAAAAAAAVLAGRGSGGAGVAYGGVWSVNEGTTTTTTAGGGQPGTTGTGTEMMMAGAPPPMRPSKSGKERKADSGYLKMKQMLLLNEALAVGTEGEAERVAREKEQRRALSSDSHEYESNNQQRTASATPLTPQEKTPHNTQGDLV